MHILNLIQADLRRFITLAYLDTLCFTHIQIYSHSYTYRGIFAHIRAHFIRFRDIEDPGITGSNNVFKSIRKIFFIFVSKVNIQHFFLQDSISIITVTIIITFHPRYPRQHATHATHLPQVARQFSNSIPRSLVSYIKKACT